MNIKSLLEKLKEYAEIHLSYYTCSGLCICIEKMHKENIIDNYDSVLLTRYLRSHKPEHISFGGLLVYWWPAGQKEPRLQWLEEQINSL